MCAYMSKSEDNCSNAIKQVFKTFIGNKCGNSKQLRDRAHPISSNQEYSVQETVHHCLSKSWLLQIFPVVIYVNTNIPEKRFRVLHSQKQIRELPDDSDNICKRNMPDKYLNRPDGSFCNGKNLL